MSRYVTSLLAVWSRVFFGSGAVPSLFAEEYSLDDLYRIALARSEILKVAEENLVIAEIGKDKAFSYLLPRLTATGGVTQYSEKKFYRCGEHHPTGIRFIVGGPARPDRLPERP